MNLLGRDVQVIEESIESSKEFFNEYTLADGTVLKVKNVVTSIVQIEGQTLPDGSPLFLVFSTPVVNVESSPGQRRTQ